MPTWTDGERRDVLRVQMVNPTNYGHLGYLNVTSASITEAYNSDTRIQGTITALDANETYIPLAMIRLIHEAEFSNGEHYRRILGTFFAIRSRDTWRSGAQETEFELKSVLYGMQDDLAPFDMTIAKNSTAQAAFNAVCSKCNRPRLWITGANNKRFAKNRTLEAGDSYLSWLHQLANMAGNRLDCDERGRVIMEPYTAPSKRSAKMRLAFNSSLVLASGFSRSSNEAETPGRSIVTWEHEYTVKVKDGTYALDTTDKDGVFHSKGSTKYTTKKERKTITDYADVTSGNAAHISRRGFRVSEWHALDDLGDSKSTAQAKAKSYLASDSKPTVTWSIQTRWFEVYEGDVIAWKPSQDEPYRNCLVTDADKDLFAFTINLSLKEV